jgi:hypothetical protein
LLPHEKAVLMTKALKHRPRLPDIGLKAGQ